MTHRITKNQLEFQITTINHLTDSPATTYTKDDNGKFSANIGNYHLDWAYGGVNLVQMASEGGGITCPIGQGYRTKRELFNEMRAFIAGLAL